ncbi:MAG TPA: hypothetical protein VHE78_11040 [Gemmatimonadaceae bacterium]|nr:hypothetical protein [Gemmatimonadaceae bacterium]
MTKQWSLLVFCASALAFTPASRERRAPEFPRGTFTTTIARGDVPADIPDETATSVASPWEISFTDNGKLIARKDGADVVRGDYAATATSVVFSNDSGEYACGVTGTYAWKLDDKNLVFTKSDDSCAGRVVVLTVHPLKPKS